MAGSQVRGKDEFKPVVRWDNKSTTPSQTLLLTCHTHHTFSLLERYALQAKLSPAPKRIKYEDGLVDLTNDDVETNEVNTPRAHRQEHVEVVDEEVSIVKRPREVPLVDMTDESAPVSSTLTLDRT